MNGTCPMDYTTYLINEGGGVCVPVATNGRGPAGFTLDTASEGRRCI